MKRVAELVHLTAAVRAEHWDDCLAAWKDVKRVVRKVLMTAATEVATRVEKWVLTTADMMADLTADLTDHMKVVR